ncbi:MAG: endonuclease III domain-containing protein [Gemmatimonadales bacterium]
MPSLAASRARKHPFNIDIVLHQISEVVRPLPKAAMFALAEEGYSSLFEQLIACILSVRTRDEVSLVAARRLFETAPKPEDLAGLRHRNIDQLIGDVTFHEAKAAQIQDIARQTLERYGGKLPCDVDVLRSFRGVGPKCAHLALGIACGEERISVDIHVHRVANRWGYIRAPTSEQSMEQLEARLPRRYWIEINALLVPFGKHICTGRLPHCTTCPVLDMCQQVAVGKPR